MYGTTDGTPPATGAVEVTGFQGDWQLTVGGQPYTVKGLTWGTDGGTKPLLDSAAANGIRVVNGFWLQPGGGPGSGGCVDYVTDPTYKTDMLTEFAKWVEEYKSHPATLMWNVGNESVTGPVDGGGMGRE